MKKDSKRLGERLKRHSAQDYNPCHVFVIFLLHWTKKFYVGFDTKQHNLQDDAMWFRD